MMTNTNYGEPLTKSDLNLLYDVATSVYSIRNFDEMLRKILLKIKSVFHIEGASIALHDAANREFYFIRTVEEERDGHHEEMEKMRFPDNYGVAGWVLHENQSVLIPDVAQDNRFVNRLALQEQLPTHSMICVPLRTRRGMIGILYAINKLKGVFSTKELQLLEILSGTIAITVENAQLYEDLKKYAGSLEEENIRLKSQVQNHFHLQGIIGSSAPMRRLFELIQKVIGTPTTVFIQGATGTGKELVARVIHYSGVLKNKPFVAENCGALSENLLESELFGHVKGAFTGAIADKKGLFQMAEGGTVFLDEIADMPQAMQIKLLRVLQEGTVRPVGSSQTIQVDFRLIVSSNRDLSKEVEKGNFRDDLYYRIHVFPILLPPLKDRRDDIGALAAHFLDKYTRKFDRPMARLTPEALELLGNFNWPGNVRELENEIERAVTLAGTDREITKEHLSQKIKAHADDNVFNVDTESNLQAATEQLERQMITNALTKTEGNRSQASRILGLTRQGLINKIARYQINL